MEDYIVKQAKHFAKLTHANTRDYEKLINLQNRFVQEIQPYVNSANQFQYVTEYEKEVRSLFAEHLQRCKSPSTCPQNKTHDNAVFLSGQEKERIQKILDYEMKNTVQKGDFFDNSKAVPAIISPADKDKVLKNLIQYGQLERLLSCKPQELAKEIELEINKLEPILNQFQRRGFITDLNFRRDSLSFIILLEAQDYYFRGGFEFQEEILEQNINKLLLEIESIKKDLKPNHLETANKIAAISSAIFSAIGLFKK